MKRKNVVLILMFLLIGTSMVNAQEIVNLFDNPGFEEGEGTDVQDIPGWQLYKQSDATGLLTIDTEEAIEGNQCVFIEVTGVPAGGTWNLRFDHTRRFSVEQGTTYTMSFWLKGDAGPVTLSASRAEQNDAGQWGALAQEIVNPTEEWQEYHLTFESSEDRLMTAVRLAIAGNVIDFGTDSSFDLTEELETILSQDFAVNHFKKFCEVLKQARNILYLADNAGETVFDRLLIEEMDKPVIYLVREKPIINDATREDALLSGLDKVSEITSSGCDTPGTILKFCSDEFLETYRSANLIISKGQGNYEALSDEERPLFFLLKVKCQVVARDLGVKNGSIILAEAGRLRLKQSVPV